MRLASLFLFLSLTQLLAWDPPQSPESRLQSAVWAGTGIAGPATYVGDVGGEHIWKAALSVKHTLKGAEQKSLVFYFQQGEAPGKSLTKVRCPDYPSVPANQEITVYLHSEGAAPHTVYFLTHVQPLTKP